jgi:hypothetical protein
MKLCLKVINPGNARGHVKPKSNMQKTKHFRIGEYAIGGIIKAQIKSGELSVQNLTYGTRKVVLEKRFCKHDKRNEVLLHLCDVTSVYHADAIMRWIDIHYPLERGWC